MNFDMLNGKREMKQISLRLFIDLLDKLNYLAKVKYRGRRNMSELMRDGLEEYVDREMEEGEKPRRR
jgi:predicted DNA-binding protein